MQAINHVATALVLKKVFPSVPLFALILSTEAVEYLWVGLNLAGIEVTRLDPGLASVADIHLVHMPFSHSIATSVILAASVALLIVWRCGREGLILAAAIGLGIVSHIVLDLVVHAPDIVLAPFFDSVKLGSGLYHAAPLIALGVETAWGVYCWRVYRGGWPLLAVIVGLNASSIAFYSVSLNLGESALAGRSADFAVLVLVQMIMASALVWWLARTPRRARSEAERPGGL